MLSFHRYLLGAYYVLGFIRCEDVMINQTDVLLVLRGLIV